MDQIGESAADKLRAILALIGRTDDAIKSPSKGTRANALKRRIPATKPPKRDPNSEGGPSPAQAA